MLQKIDYLKYLDECWREHLKPKPDNAPKVISTFAGCGGSSLGYSMAGFRELLAVEWEDNSVETFRMNFPDVPVYHGDIAKLSVDECLSLAGIKAGELDILDGSPPCQGFSTIGKWQIDDDRNYLFREYVRLLRGLRPKVFVMENVSGMVKGVMRFVFVEILRELKASGYKVSARVLNALYFGVPQIRERIIFVGVRDDLGMEPSHPAAWSKPISAKIAIDGIINDTQEIEWLLRSAMTYASYQGWPDMPIGTSRRNLGLNGFNGRKFNPYKPARTILKSDGYIASYGAMHWAERRRFTVAEFKRFASFPDRFVFCGGYKAVERIGNSVPPLFMKSIAEHIKTEILAHAPQNTL